MKIFITDQNYQGLKPLGFHQQVERTLIINGEHGIIVDDTSFYLFASMHLDGNTDFRIEDTNLPDVKKLRINIVFDQVDPEPFPEPEPEEEYMGYGGALEKASDAAWCVFEENLDDDGYEADNEAIVGFARSILSKLD